MEDDKLRNTEEEERAGEEARALQMKHSLNSSSEMHGASYASENKKTVR